MSLEEEGKLFNLGLVGSGSRFRPIVRLGVHLGARLGELTAIKRADINLSTKPFSVKLRSKGQDVKVEVRPKSRADSQEQEWEAANDSFEQCSKGDFRGPSRR